MDKKYLVPWTAEKSRNVVEYLSKVVDEVRSEPSASSLADALGSALYNATKIMAEFNGGNWDPDDRQLIIQRGSKGYEELLVKYGLLEETTEDRRARLAKSSIHDLRTFLEQERAVGRRLINDLLYSLDPTDPWVSKVIELTDKVNMAEIEWDIYVTDLSIVLNEWEQSIE